MKKIAFILLFAPLVLFAQNYAKKDFYLVDSLDIAALSESDKLLLDSSLALFHKTKLDTIKLQVLANIISNLMTEDWVKYNDYTHSYVEKLIRECKDKNLTNYYKIHLANTINNFGYIFLDKGMHPQAMEKFNEALKLSEEINSKHNIASCYNNIGYIYHQKDNLKKAVEYYAKFVEICKEIDDREGIAIALNNIGGIYKREKEYKKALNNYFQSLTIYKFLENDFRIAESYNNIGNTYSMLGMADSSLYFSSIGLEISLKVGDKAGASYCYAGIGNEYLKLGNYKKATEYLEKSYQIAKEIQKPRSILIASNHLHELYRRKGQFEKAFETYKEYIIMRDSLNNLEHDEKFYKMELNYEYEKQKVLDQKENEKLIAIEKEKEHKQLIIIYFTVGFALVLAVFLFYVINRLLVIRRQAEIIKQQKHQVDEAYEELNQTNEEILAQRDQIEYQKIVVEEKNALILDSISYASNLQKSILSTEEDLKKHFPETFVFNKPKDLVSGDFYWILEREGLIYFAVADCTGHGVPGALLAIACSRLLDKAADKYKFKDAGQMLDYVHDEVVNKLKKSTETVDGMDIALCIFNKKSQELQFAGAHNSAVIIRNSEIHKLQGDNRPIGFTYKNKQYKSFTKQSFNAQSGDTIYLFTDGFADQFGGKEYKKYYNLNFEKFLAELHPLPMDAQLSSLENEFYNWKGNRDQFDDVCVVGIKI